MVFEAPESFKISRSSCGGTLYRDDVWKLFGVGSELSDKVESVETEEDQSESDELAKVGVGIGGVGVETGVTSENVPGRKLLRVVIRDEMKLVGVKMGTGIGFALGD